MVHHSHTILIVDDMKINRSILSKMLISDYNILEAQDGQEAIDILNEHSRSINIVLLDLIMPKVNGHEVLKYMQNDSILSSIPVIVISGASDAKVELKCLTEGATEFISKPFYAEIVKNRIASIVRLRENSSILKSLEYDRLTNVYTKEYFYHIVRKVLSENPNDKFTIVSTDIENFRVVNEVYGTKKGDEVLQYLAHKHQEKCQELKGVCARFASNTFVMLFRQFKDGFWDQEKAGEYIDKRFSDCPIKPIVIKFGFYDITDNTADISSMCDRAILALNSVKNKYTSHFAYYDEAMRQTLLKRQMILDSMEEGLSERQFSIYLQPKHSLIDGSVAGAEALVRWTHPKFGFMSPGDFIPIFEKNGFITKLDFYVWDATCAWISKRKKEKFSLLPISVNVSRADFSQIDLVETMNNLIEKYDIEPKYLHLEVTESAYTGNPHQLIQTVEELRSCGFKIEMDDFGSGYSSLNMLSEMPIDLLKLDMQFMQKHKNSLNNRSILSFIVSLSKWLGFPTIAEGVETEEDIQLLKSMGCNYVQGYYFAKPMPIPEFEKYVTIPRSLPVAPKDEEYESVESMRDRPTEKVDKVLIVEDIPMNRSALELMLNPYYHVMTATNGLEALSMMENKNNKISLVLLDLMMPVMDGFELLKRMHTNKALNNLPVIITSEAGVDSELKALRLGASNFLPKPYQKEVLLHQVRTAIDSAQLYCLKNNLKD